MVSCEHGEVEKFRKETHDPEESCRTGDPGGCGAEPQLGVRAGFPTWERRSAPSPCCWGDGKGLTSSGPLDVLDKQLPLFPKSSPASLRASPVFEATTEKQNTSIFELAVDHRCP